MTDLSVLENGTGTPLVLLHAFPLSARMWQRQLTDLPGPDGSRARVIAPDLPGFGGTPPRTDPPALELLADDVAGLLDRLGVARAVVGGLSMGGYVAMQFARRHPHRLAGLLLADTKAGADPAPARANRERIAAAVLARDSVRLLVEERMEETLLAPGTPAALAAEVRELMATATPAGAAWAQRAMAARTEAFEVLAGLRVPAAVVVGAEDALAPPSEAEAMAQALPDVELTLIPLAGHLSALEAPEAFTVAVLGLLRRVERAGSGPA
ncbi:alpha/beta fold hydrolase [Kitasatospora sp. NPDC052896]|uniref:alpha/beta fold hydrolase n=1 Tax=Kitasatospora sp. NPDC052896 TaxID=3364061 RepID=UPI0037CB33D0